MLMSDIPTIGVLDYPVTLYFCFLVALVQLVAAVNLCFFTAAKVSLRWFGRLVGELDVSTMQWTSQIWFGLYPKDLKNPTNMILQTH